MSRARRESNLMRVGDTVPLGNRETMEWGDRAAGAGQRELNGNWDGKTVWRIRFQVGEGRSKKKTKFSRTLWRAAVSVLLL